MTPSQWELLEPGGVRFCERFAEIDDESYRVIKSSLDEILERESTDEEILEEFLQRKERSLMEMDEYLEKYGD